MIGLTRQQKKLLEVIKSHLREHGVPPSFDEMNDAMGLNSKGNTHRLVTALEERGCIRRLPNRARSIEVVDPITAEQFLFLPANHRQFLIWYASKHKTTPQAIVTNCVREWAIRTAA